jgi:hypothetical protein
MPNDPHLAYRRWETGEGAVTITFKALRPFRFKPSLALMRNGQPTRIVVTASSDGYSAVLTADKVALLRASPSPDDTTHLLLTANAAYRPGAPDREWKWGLALSRNGSTFACFDENGAGVASGASGLIESPIHTFPDKQPLASDFWAIDLS